MMIDGIRTAKKTICRSVRWIDPREIAKATIASRTRTTAVDDRLSLRGAVNAEACGGERLEPGGRDRLVTRIPQALGAGFLLHAGLHPVEGLLQLFDQHFPLPPRGRGLTPHGHVRLA